MEWLSFFRIFIKKMEMSEVYMILSEKKCMNYIFISYYCTHNLFAVEASKEQYDLNCIHTSEIILFLLQPFQKRKGQTIIPSCALSGLAGR